MGTNESTSPPDMPVPEPDVKPSSTPDGPQVVPSPSTPPGEPGPDPEPSPEDAGLTGAPNGAMGVSSERVPGDPDSVEGTGSRGTATLAPAGSWPTMSEGEPEPDDPRPHPQDPAEGPEMDDRQQQATQEWREDQPAANVDPEPAADPGVSSGTTWQGIDRTVGEQNPAEVPPHDFDPTANPGHSHG